MIWSVVDYFLQYLLIGVGIGLGLCIALPVSEFVKHWLEGK